MSRFLDCGREHERALFRLIVKAYYVRKENSLLGERMNPINFRRRTALTVCVLTALIMLALILQGCSARNTSGTRVAGLNSSTIKIALAKSEFATYKPIPVKYTPAVTMAPLKPDFSNVYKYGEWYFDPEEKELLKKNHFVIKPGSHRFAMYELYEGKDLPAFVSSDAVLHAYHQLFDRALIYCEDQFSKDLETITAAMYAASLKEYIAARDKDIREAARRNAAYFGVALRLLGVKREAPAGVSSLIEQEIKLIEKREGFRRSPIFGYHEDYSQFIPRGHYTRSDGLKRYFKAMMWYGRMGFYTKPVQGPRGAGRIAIDRELVRQHTRQALMITRSIIAQNGQGEANPYKLWESIYEPTAFFVGYSDDLNLHDYVKLVGKVYGNTISDEALADQKLLDGFIDKASNHRLPQISSTGLGVSASDEVAFKFMGQRLVPDSRIFQQLVFPEVDRDMPNGLDVPAVLGSARAYEILDKELKETGHSGYAKKVAELKKEFSGLNESTWTQNLYWGWLYSLRALLGERGDGYPGFMQSKAWQDKSLTTFLGSWAELRRDTILYDKQSETLLRGIMDGAPENADAYVEPNPELYARLLALTEMTKTGLKQRGLVKAGDVLDRRLGELAELLKVCKSASEKELSGLSISDAENEYLKNFDKILKGFDYRFDLLGKDTPGISNSWDEDNDQVIADVHTDTNSNTCLEVATGKPAEIYVIAPVEGKPVLFRGAVFSYYEFTKPISERMTDEEWFNTLMLNKEPDAPTWNTSYLH